MAQRFLYAVLHFYLTLAIIAHAQPDFLSIDCGLVDVPNYTDEITNIIYQSDKDLIDDSAESHSISLKYKTQSLERQFWYVRSFPEGNRNCYAIDNSFQGNGKKQYLIRARFMYGNYDNKNSTPKFDLYLRSTFWESVEFEKESTIVTKEIIYTPLTYDHIHVCLINTKRGTPFISVLERRELIDYDKGVERALMVSARFNLGSPDGKIVRYPDDVYDRIWKHYDSVELKGISTSRPIKADGSSSTMSPPSIVMKTAATPANVSNNMTLSFRGLRYDNEVSYFAVLFFAEVQKLQPNEIREFDISVGEKRSRETFHPDYLHVGISVIHYYKQSDDTVPEDRLELWINRSSRSTLPPLVNAIEFLEEKGISPSHTDRKDYEAIMNIKQLYRIQKNWQGDPCTPRPFMWEGLNCSYSKSDEFDPHRITHLNLSSSGLLGMMIPWISKLIYLQYLDLSNNKLNGDVPDFLSQLKFLTFLNIEGNELSGTIPPELIKRTQNGQLQLRYGRNPRLCNPGPCKKKHKDKIVITVAASFGGAFVIVLAAITFSIFKRRQQRDVGGRLNKLGFYSNISKRLMLISHINKRTGSKNQQLTYAEILSITNNFERVVGKGGFGTVYHGHLGNTQVAVKMLSPSTQGFLQFQTEANLLTRVHHKCLTPLLGYCHEGTNIALIYEYMPNGDLAKLLSDNEKFPSWKQRIQIAVDAAEGLEYLHNGCKPPIVHRDIKPRNILLNEKLRGKIADFGLSKIFPHEDDTHVFTVIAGTPGYLDPEYYVSNKLNEKSDVFSFGVVLLELITGRPSINKTEEKAHITQWVASMLPESEIHDIVDSRLQGEFDSDSARKALDIAMSCVAPASINRPGMSQVVMDLKQCLGMEITLESDPDWTTSKSLLDVSNLSDITISGESSLLRGGLVSFSVPVTLQELGCDTKAEIVSRTTIKSSSPTPSNLQHFKISFLDQIAPPSFYVPIVLLYSDLTHHDFTKISENLRALLSQVLTLYYPFCGRIKGNKSNAFVDCNDEGVLYLEARIPLKLSDFLCKNQQPNEIKAFLPLDPFNPKSENDDEDPFIMEVQVTQFSCGSVGIGVCISHRICDGATIASFLQAWSETTMADGKYNDASHSPPNMEASLLFPPKDIEMSRMTGMIVEKNISTSRFLFSEKSLSRLRDKLVSGGCNFKPTRVEAVTTLIWKSAMEAAGEAHQSMVSHAVNIRRFMVPPLPENSIGNIFQQAISPPLVKVDKAKEVELQDLAEVVRETIRKIDGNYVSKLQEDGEGVYELLKSLKEVKLLVAKKGVPCYSFSSWTGFRFYEAEFGWGKPTWVCTIGVPIRNVTILMPTRCGEGIEAWVTLNELHMAQFESNSELLQFASFDP